MVGTSFENWCAFLLRSDFAFPNLTKTNGPSQRRRAGIAQPTHFAGPDLSAERKMRPANSLACPPARGYKEMKGFSKAAHDPFSHGGFHARHSRTRPGPPRVPDPDAIRVDLRPGS